MKKIIIVISGLVVLGLLVSTFIFLFKSNKLSSELAQAKEMTQRMQEEMAHIQAEKEKAIKENEKLQSDIVSYVALNTKVQEEKERLQKNLEEAQKIIENKEADLERLNKKLLETEAKITKEQPQLQDKLFKEKEELGKKIKLLDEALQKERALYHYNLGVSYAHAKFYDEAIGAYEKSLFFNPNNPEAHYNLGLLYADYKSDSEKAIFHYKKYLELKPEAEDKEEVEARIKRLE